MKVVRDPVYQFIELEDFAVILIDTPQFQRLRNLKQLGLTNFIYPSATHTRFEHSLGVYHLTKLALENLVRQIENCSVIDQNALRVVKIAALLHDIGHGPFSHLFERVIEESGLRLEASHELVGGQIIRQMLGTVGADGTELRERIGISEEDIESICLLIEGKVPENPIFQQYRFLAQIVSNSANGLDTDKLDYLARDSEAVGLGITIDPRRIFSNISIFKHPQSTTGAYYLSYNVKTKVDLLEVYHTRYILTKQIYYHPKCIGTSILVSSLLQEAFKEQLVDIEKMYRRAVIPDDGIVGLINEKLEERGEDSAAETLMRHFTSHRLPKLVFSTAITAECELTENISYLARAKLVADFIRKETALCSDYFHVHVSDINYGVKHQNPLDYIPLHSNNTVFVPKEYWQANPQTFAAVGCEELYSVRQLEIQGKQSISHDDPDLLMPIRFHETHVLVFLGCLVADSDAESVMEMLANAIEKYLIHIGELTATHKLLLARWNSNGTLEK